MLSVARYTKPGFVSADRVRLTAYTYVDRRCTRFVDSVFVGCWEPHLHTGQATLDIATFPSQ